MVLFLTEVSDIVQLRHFFLSQLCICNSWKFLQVKDKAVKSLEINGGILVRHLNALPVQKERERA